MATSENVHPVGEEEEGIDLGAAWSLIWSHKLLVAGVGFLGAVIAAVFALLATPVFRAEATVVEVHDSGMRSATSSLMSQFGGLASLAGVNIGGGENNDSTAVLKSRNLIEQFIRRYDLVPVLYPKAKKTPTVWRAVQRFKGGVLTLREDKRAGTTTVVVDWQDPEVAARWANDFIALANQTLRERALTQSKRNVDYLNGQLAHTNVVEIQRVMYNLIESETKTLMLANGRLEYAFTVVDPAVKAEERISPRRTLMVLVGGVIGGFLGTVIVLVRAMVRRRKAVAA